MSSFKRFFSISTLNWDVVISMLEQCLLIIPSNSKCSWKVTCYERICAAALTVATKDTDVTCLFRVSLSYLYYIGFDPTPFIYVLTILRVKKYKQINLQLRDKAKQVQRWPNLVYLPKAICDFTTSKTNFVSLFYHQKIHRLLKERFIIRLPSALWQCIGSW